MTEGRGRQAAAARSTLPGARAGRLPSGGGDAGLAGAPAVPGASARERARAAAAALMALALACSPAYVVRPQVGPLPTTLLEIVLVAAIAAGLYAYRDELPWRTPYTWPALLLLVAATVDTVVSPDRRHAAGLWKAYFVEPVLAGLVVAAIARRRDRARLLLAGLAVAGAVVALANVAAVLQAVRQHTFSELTPPVAIYQSANSVPLFLEPLLAFALALAFFSDDRRERTIAGAFAAVAAAAVVLSFSRGGWLTLAALVLFAGMFSRRRWQALAGTAAAAAAAFALSGRVRQRVLVELDPASSHNSLSLRGTLWRSTLDMLLHRPLFGGGLSGFKSALQPYRAAGYRESLVNPNDLLLTFWSETGLLGLAAFGWLAVQVVRTALRGLAGDRWAWLMAVGALGLLLAFGLHGIVDTPYFKNDQALAFWALLGVQAGSLGRGAAREAG